MGSSEYNKKCKLTENCSTELVTCIMNQNSDLWLLANPSVLGPIHQPVAFLGHVSMTMMTKARLKQRNDSDGENASLTGKS